MPNNKIETRTRILDATWRLMEARPTEAVHMADIAKAAGVSRQAVYLHFETRTALMIATVQYVDEIKGLNERLRNFESAQTGVELLEACVDVWGNYIPEIYGLARALLNTRHTDEAAATAWNGSIACVRDLCQHAIDRLAADGGLSKEWSRKAAVEMMWALLSIHNWEQLVIESKFSTRQYVAMIQKILRQSLVQEPASRTRRAKPAANRRSTTATAPGKATR